MSTVSAEARTGKARLCLVINDEVYGARKVAGKIRLRKLSGERAGAIYYLGRDGAGLACTCPDTVYSPGFQCKHKGAVLAVRLLPRPRAAKGGGR